MGIQTKLEEGIHYYMEGDRVVFTALSLIMQGRIFTPEHSFKISLAKQNHPSYQNRKNNKQIKTEGTKRVLHVSDAALNDAKQALVDLEAKHSQLGLNRASVESKFYSEGALGELNPTLKTVLDILKGISSVRGR